MHFMHTLRLALCFLSLAVAPWISAESPESTPMGDPVAIELIAEQDSIQPGTPIWIAIRFKMDDHWHAYWKNPGDAGMAPVVSWNLPEGFKAEPLVWPTPKRFVLGTSVGFGYENDLVLLAKIIPPTNYSQDSASIGADVRWVVCNDETCLPGDSESSLNIPVAKETPKTNASHTTLFSEARAQIPQPIDSIAAVRKQDLIELNINDTAAEPRIFHKAEFYPEDQQTIDCSKDILLQRSNHLHCSLTRN